MIKNWHHANLIVGQINFRLWIRDVLKNDFGFNVDNNPDYLIFDRELFGIDDARDYEKWSLVKPLSGDRKVSAIIMDSITTEAQNALLKVLEEPKEGHVTFINMSDNQNLLPTFLSRVRVVNLEIEKDPNKTDDKVNNQTNKSTQSNFLDIDLKKKLSFAKDLSKKDNKNLAKELIRDLDYVFYSMKGGPIDLVKIKKILKAKKYLKARGSSPKVVIEWLASVL